MVFTLIFFLIGPSSTMALCIKNEKANLRKGPGTEHPMVRWAPLGKYFSMKVLKVKNNWVHIEDAAGDKAWIYRPLVWIQ